MADNPGLHGRYNPDMIARIGPKQPFRHFLKEWREHRGLTQEELANRLDTGKDQVSRWENNKRGMSADVIAALCEALRITPSQLFRHPDTPSADDLLSNATPEQRRQAFTVIDALIKSTGTN